MEFKGLIPSGVVGGGPREIMGQIQIARELGMTLDVDPGLQGVCFHLQQQATTTNLGKVLQLDHLTHEGKEVSRVTFAGGRTITVDENISILEAGERFGGLVRPVCLHKVQR